MNLLTLLKRKCGYDQSGDNRYFGCGKTAWCWAGGWQTKKIEGISGPFSIVYWRCGECTRKRSEEERHRIEASRLHEEKVAKKQLLLDANADLVMELVQLVGADGGFANKDRIREIGKELSRQGGLDLMRAVHSQVKGDGPYFSQDIWDGIGMWRA